MCARARARVRANFGGVSTFLWPNLKRPQVYHLTYLILNSLEHLRVGSHTPHQTFTLSACCLHQILPSLHSFLFAFFLSFQQVYSCILTIAKNKTNKPKKQKQTDKKNTTPNYTHGERDTGKSLSSTSQALLIVSRVDTIFPAELKRKDLS